MSLPRRENTSTAPAAGALQGVSAAHTGLVGPRITVPNRPLRSGERCAPAAVTNRSPPARMATNFIVGLSRKVREVETPKSVRAGLWPALTLIAVRTSLRLDLADPGRPVADRAPDTRSV